MGGGLHGVVSWLQDSADCTWSEAGDGRTGEPGHQGARVRRREATWEERLLVDKVQGGLTLRVDLAGHGNAGRQDHGDGLLYSLEERHDDE